MRQARFNAPEHFPSAFYHCISRVAGRDFLFGRPEKERFVNFLRRYELFTGVRAVTFCVMDNHFHLLLEVPKRPEVPLTDEELTARIAALDGRLGASEVLQALENLRSIGAQDAAEALRESYFVRMWNLSAFMKGLKQRFTRWFNGTHGRKGTLWEERFKSVLIEAAGDSLATIAAYIDLNPVRAGMVQDPKDYRWCSYAQTVAGNKTAREGLAVITRYLTNRPSGAISKAAILAEYRRLLYLQGEERGLNEQGAPLKKGFKSEEIQAVLDANGKLTRPELVRCRVRYFVDGCVIGSKAFVDDVFIARRERFGPRRTSGARLMRATAPPLYAMRDLQQNVLS